MKKEIARLTPIALAVSALLMSTGISAAEQSPAAGVVVMTVGNVTVTGGAGGGRSLQRRSQIFTGETITTGKESRAQIRFSDGSLISLQEGSQFRIESYSYQQEKKGNNATYQLLKGGMRTISGAVGKVNRDEYKVATPVATIGIRGTDYELMLHDSDNSGSDELYGYINDGVIHVATQGGNQDFSDNEFFGVAGPNMPPQSLLNPPGFMFEGYVPNGQPSGDTGANIPLEPSLVAILTNTENSDLLNSTINPMITPYATVTQLTGWVSYGIPPEGGFMTDQNGQVATSLTGMADVDFTTQWINNIWFNATFADGRTVYLSSDIQLAAPISSAIGQGDPIALTGTCGGGSCGAAAALTLSGNTSVQFIGPGAEGIAATYDAQDGKATQTFSGSAVLTQDAVAAGY